MTPGVTSSDPDPAYQNTILRLLACRPYMLLNDMLAMSPSLQDPDYGTGLRLSVQLGKMEKAGLIEILPGSGFPGDPYTPPLSSFVPHRYAITDAGRARLDRGEQVYS